MLNCMPSFAFCRPESMACSVETLCPYCWSRAALERWRHIDSVLFGTPLPIRAKPAKSKVKGTRVAARVLAYTDDDDDEPETPATLTRRNDLAMIYRRIVYKLPAGEGGIRPAKLVAYRLSQGKPPRKANPAAGVSPTGCRVGIASCAASAGLACWAVSIRPRSSLITRAAVPMWGCRRSPGTLTKACSRLQGRVPAGHVLQEFRPRPGYC